MKKQKAAPRGLGKTAVTRRAPAEAPGSLERELVALAATGKLANAGHRAITAQKERGLAITYQRGQEIIKVHADGRVEVIGKTDRPRYTVPKGVRVIK